MRELVLIRIQELRKQFSDFSPRVMRWKYTEHKGEHISKVDFKTLEDADLLEMYELIVRRCSIMM